jgi:apolipoprotein N-acyltransferase
MAKALDILHKYPGWIALIAGGISATGFEPLNLWPVTLICLALLMHLVASAETAKQAFRIGWLFGLGHFTIGNNWIAKAFTYQASMPEWLGWLAVPLLALYLAVYPGLAAWGAWRIAKLAAPQKLTITLPFVLSFAGCWIIAEWLRSWVFTGFAWNPLSVIMLRQFYGPGLIQWIGSYGASGLLVLQIGLLIWSWQYFRRRSPRFKNSAGGVAVWLILPGFWFGGVHWLDSYGPTEVFSSPATNITIVQPNISQIDKNSPNYDSTNFRRLAKNTIPKDSKSRLIFWPESAIPWYLHKGYPYRYYQFQPGESPEMARAVLGGLMNSGDILVTGNDRLEFDKEGQLIGARNSVTAMTSDGRLLGYYDKAHLVPFGEYLALRWLLEPLGATRLVPGTIDFWEGPGPRTQTIPFDGRSIKAGVQICYEIVFSGQVVDRTNRPEFIFNPSTDAWFGSWGPPQHLAQARLRAIEEGLPVIRSTPTGISAVIDADGWVRQSLPPNQAGRIEAQLPKAKAPTLFARHGNILPLGFAALLILLALLPLARRRALRYRRDRT